jgi:hypothetical protein
MATHRSSGTRASIHASSISENMEIQKRKEQKKKTKKQKRDTPKTDPAADLNTAPSISIAKGIVTRRAKTASRLRGAAIEHGPGEPGFAPIGLRHRHLGLVPPVAIQPQSVGRPVAAGAAGLNLSTGHLT